MFSDFFKNYFDHNFSEFSSEIKVSKSQLNFFLKLAIYHHIYVAVFFKCLCHDWITFKIETVAQKVLAGAIPR